MREALRMQKHFVLIDYENVQPTECLEVKVRASFMYRYLRQQLPSLALRSFAHCRTWAQSGSCS
jgi:hypothetical protein